MQSFIGIGTPYDADHSDLMEDVNNDYNKRNAPFLPACASEVICLISSLPRTYLIVTCQVTTHVA